MQEDQVLMTEQAALGSQVRRGLGWSLGNNIISKLGTIVMGIILARLLDPSDYGEFTVALVALVIISNINDLGLEPTVVRWPGSIDEIAPTAWTTIFGSSCLLFAIVCAAAGPFTSALNAPEAVNIVRLLAVGVVINGMFAIPSAVLTRTFRQDLRTAADAIGFVATLVVTISLAVAGYGAWSLAWGRVVGNGVISLMHVIFARYPVRPGWSPQIARALLRQGLPIAGTLLLATVTMNVDYLVVGRMLGATTLGFYLMAFNLSTSPVKLFSTAVANVALPGFAKLQDDLVALRSGFVRSLTWLMWVTIPVGVGLSIAATALCSFVYGSRWAPAGQALRFLALVGIMRVALQLGSDLLVAVGRSRSTLWLQGLWLVTLLPAVVVGAHVAGIKGVGVAHLVVAGGVMIPAYLVSLRAVGLKARDFAPTLAGPVLGGLVAVVVGNVLVTHIGHELPVLLLAGTLAILGPLLPVNGQLRTLAAEFAAKRRVKRDDGRQTAAPAETVGAVALAESWEP